LIFPQLAPHLVQHHRITADTANATNRAVTPGVGRGSVDAVFVNVQVDV
jgi:hypothetical protein